MKAIFTKILKVARYVFFLSIAIVLLLEMLFRLYDPFGFRQRGNEVVLPRNRTMIFENKIVPGIGKKIVHTKNSLGFRGPEPPGNFSDYTTIIAVGGSTTECFYLSDSMCWTNLLSHQLQNNVDRLWINNAGFQGHSTYGNFILINDYIKQLKPKYVLLMEGMNEINRFDLRYDESVSVYAGKTTLWGWLKRNSHVLNAVINVQRHIMADRLGVTDNYFDPAKVEQLLLSQKSMDSAILRQQPLAESYAERLNQIVDTCLANNIQPVLITQPVLYGDGKDCVTGIDLATIKNSDGYNGKLVWELLELYNEKTRSIAQNKKLFLIDLANEMPRCSKYFYDVCHFTNEGSEKVSEILSGYLEKYLSLDRLQH
jgi:hypothetical protein